MSRVASGSAPRSARTLPSIASRLTFARVARIPPIAISRDAPAESRRRLGPTGIFGRGQRLQSRDQLDEPTSRGESDDLPRIVDDRHGIDALLEHERGELGNRGGIPNANDRRGHQLLRSRRHHPAQLLFKWRSGVRDDDRVEKRDDRRHVTGGLALDHIRLGTDPEKLSFANYRKTRHTVL